MFNKHFLWLFQNVSILTEPGTNHDASLFLRAASLSCRTIFTGRNRRFPCCIRPDQNTPGQTKAPFSPRNAEKRVQVNVFTWPCRNRHSPVRSETPSVLSGINRIQRWSQSKPPYLVLPVFFVSIYSILSRGRECHQE